MQSFAPLVILLLSTTHLSKKKKKLCKIVRKLASSVIREIKRIYPEFLLSVDPLNGIFKALQIYLISCTQTYQFFNYRWLLFYKGLAYPKF